MKLHTLRQAIVGLILAGTLGFVGYVAAQPPGAPIRWSPPGPASSPAPAAPPKAKVRPRQRGHVRPANLAEMIAQSHQRHFQRLKQLPRATAASFDARAQGWVGPIKDQGQCGSCWDFSGTGVVEIAYNKAGLGGGASTFILSEQYTLDCGQNGGCNGDDNTTVLAWAKSTGLPLTSAYGPYTGGPGQCNYSSSMPLFKIADWGFADSNGGQGVTSVADIKAAILAYGCVGAAVAADNSFENWGDDNPSFNAPFQGSGSTNIDHDIELVGWQDDTSQAGGYWILRNSWGTDWGVGGYMAIAYGANLVGTESVFALPPTGPTPPPGPFTYTLGAGAPAGASIDASGNFTWAIPATQAPGTITITFTAATGTSSATGTFQIVVSAAPSGIVTIAPIPQQAATAGSTFSLGLGGYVSRSAAAHPSPQH